MIARWVKRLALLAALILIVLSFAGAAVGVWGYEAFRRAAPHCNYSAAVNAFTPTQFSSDRLDVVPYLMPTYETVTIAGRDPGISLSGFYVPAAVPDAATVIIVHGLSGCKRDITLLLAAGMLHRHGFNVLLIDLRDMGDSTIEDGRHAAGTNEYRDVLAAWDWVQREQHIPAERIGLIGQSLGATSVIIALGEEAQVAAAWVDSPFADVNLLVDEIAEKAAIPIPLRWTALLSARLLVSRDLMTHSAVQSLSRLNGRPLALVHDESDTSVSIAHAYLLRDAALGSSDRVEFWVTSGSGHVQTMFDQPAEYEARLVTFFEAALNRQ
jgi:fermentation-respiration switch protein FrsA (DUF1100 family)